MENIYWSVSAIYELPHIEKYQDADKLIDSLLKELSKHLGKSMIKYFGRQKDDSALYLMQGLGVLRIGLADAFQLEGIFITEAEADKFKIALQYAAQHALPKEIAEEMLSNLIVVEKGAELELNS